MSNGRHLAWPVTPRTETRLGVQDDARLEAWRQALCSPTSHHCGAIPPEQIASYPQEWLDGLSLGCYTYIPTYQEWRDGVLPVSENRSTQSLGRPSSCALSIEYETIGPIEPPVFEGP